MTETESTRAPSTLTSLREVLRLPVRLWLLVVFMAVGFAGGFLVRGLEHQPGQPAPAVSAPDTSGIVGQVAPPLSDDQLKAGLPAGHPDLSGGSTTGSGATSTTNVPGAASTTAPPPPTTRP